MHEANLVGVHEAWVTHHVAAIGQVDRQHGATTVFDRARTVIVELLVVVRVDIASRKHRFDVGEKLGVDGHHVFEVTMSGTILNHPDLPVAFDDLRFDLADFFVDENADVFFAGDNRFARVDDAVWTERIGGAWPTEGWFALLPGFQKGFIRPFRSKRRIGLVLIYRLNSVEKASRNQGQSSLHVLNWSHRLSLTFQCFMAG